MVAIIIPDGDPVKKSDALDERLVMAGGFESIVARMAISIDKGRRALAWIAVSLLIDIDLSVAVGILAWQAHETAILAQRANNRLQVSCETTNDTRATMKSLWTFILNLPPSQPLTPQQQTETQNFKDYLNKTLVQQDCSKL